MVYLSLINEKYKEGKDNYINRYLIIRFSLIKNINSNALKIAKHIEELIIASILQNPSKLIIATQGINKDIPSNNIETIISFQLSLTNILTTKEVAIIILLIDHKLKIMPPTTRKTELAPIVPQMIQ